MGFFFFLFFFSPFPPHPCFSVSVFLHPYRCSRAMRKEVQGGWCIRVGTLWRGFLWWRGWRDTWAVRRITHNSHAHCPEYPQTQTVYWPLQVSHLKGKKSTLKCYSIYNNYFSASVIIFILKLIICRQDEYCFFFFFLKFNRNNASFWHSPTWISLAGSPLSGFFLQSVNTVVQ